jgi:[CysO sulfur-carrier protein]-S-L-cysteine hydrolase
MKILRRTQTAIIDHCKKGAPFEVCGLLASCQAIVNASYPIRNQRASETEFSMAPQDQFGAIRKMREEGLELAGNYHSHVTSPAEPSEKDIQQAHDPNLFYSIVSLKTPQKPVIKAFCIRNGKVQEEPVEVV